MAWEAAETGVASPEQLVAASAATVQHSATTRLKGTLFSGLVARAAQNLFSIDREGSGRQDVYSEVVLHAPNR
jgi:hypothetical protein